MPRMLSLEKGNFRELPPGAGTVRRLTVTPDATQAYGINLQPAVPTGAGLVWAGVRPGEPIAQSRRADPLMTPESADRSSIVMAPCSP